MTRWFKELLTFLDPFCLKIPGNLKTAFIIIREFLKPAVNCIHDDEAHDGSVLLLYKANCRDLDAEN